MVEQSGKPDTSTTDGSISHPDKKVKSEFSDTDEMHSDRDNIGYHADNIPDTSGSIRTELDPSYKPTVADRVFSGYTSF